ncbi:MAG: hypothetical protein MPJ50_17145 [Pirellulales bacterium]|nr:hypothetical protein [Pirellulales bacterium]
MNEIWKIAVGIAGLGAIAAFVVWSLYREWLRLPIFQTLTKKQQFTLFLVFLILTFLFGIAGLGTYAFVSARNGGTDGDPPAEKQSLLTFSTIRFLDDNPDKLDVLLRNTGDTVAVIDKAVFTIHAVHRLSPNVFRSDALLSTETYIVRFDDEATPYKREVEFHQRIQPDDADRFEIEIIAEDSQQGDEFVFEFSIEFHYDGKTLTTDRMFFMELFATRYLPPPQLNDVTHQLLREWHSNEGVKSKKLQGLIDDFGSMPQ